MTGEVVSYSGPGPGDSNSHNVEPPIENDAEIGKQNSSPPSSPRRCPFQQYVDVDKLGRISGTSVLDSPGISSLGRRSNGRASFMGVRRRSHLHNKTAEEVERIVQAGKIRELKNCIRSHQWLPFDCVRSRLWQIICSVHVKDKATMDSLYWDTVKQIYGTHDLVTKTGPLPTFVEPSFQMSYYLNETGIQVARRVVNIISYSCPDITYAPSLYPITCLLLHYMSEEDCYACVSHMVASKKTKFITQTKLHFETIWRTSMILCRRHAKSAVSYIAKQAGENSIVESIHQQWLNCIFKELPFQHLVRVMDCFLFEGRKVMYRVWMAILLLFHRHLASLPSNNRPALNKDSIVESALLGFCRNLPCSPEKLLRTAYGVRNFSSSEMDRLFVKTEMYLKSKAAASASGPNNKNVMVPRSRSSDVLPTSQSQVNIQMMSHTLTIREGSRSPGLRSRSLGLFPIQGVRSHAADYDRLLTVWSWLPVRITMYQPELLYTTEEHGCSMTTFFNRVEQHEPTILIVKTTTEDVFGAYCSSRWAERNSKDCHGGRQGYFGTGETFVFTLVPNEIKYPWVGISASSEGPSCVRHAAELFMASDGHMVTVGGGKAQAIWIDENIRYGKTDGCLTFNNPPLASTTDFEIRVLEVYGFQNV
ncbi:GTPase-activating protein skywalker-like isoform X1 [Daphnia carinata]|uniref:GTPase-activating protein skywalker-like isoform X1 n=1 Tax=Daphnia carinata TaxID=120202 RepID=UPI00257B9BE0|nr:GTPase-activating protein skywalker-like isoform X1 [Daphnia carinata]XP_057372880.1 GTPase-activating protein skywalker-like isoform X1 [Daphnia carinata]